MPITLSGVTVNNGMFMGNGTNVIPAPLDIYSWAYSGGSFNSTISRDTATTLSPAGGVPLRMDVTADDPYIASYNGPAWNLAPATIGQTWKATVYAKASGLGSEASIFIFGAPDSGTYIEAFVNITSIPSTWTKISCTYTLTNATTTKVQARLDGPDSGGAGKIIWFDQFLLYRIS